VILTHIAAVPDVPPVPVPLVPVPFPLWTASHHGASWPQLAPTTNGCPAKILATTNGYPAKISARPDSRSSRQGPKAPEIEGRLG
jgi:hypothetical protein